ncbi:hypothetical protein A2716_05170 [candidate division WWE3 bacterium RIFCSPHIGHO2_01_FULL_40_23]|uniref:Uncharacterized protein n=1 Tax=candidate division WWE3 bacterium RIFCSPLOWO2_01_FULL_41_18 TaxID=1802625 RepID=A0A1F4VDF1_UNCKA|nr:MAG: hypothetical protein A2716_05170 [candidate division WWE3 bacterium RIFCSPHIGHO2_01_FULL_40_23]OGC55261.1 MAG: hypothetical protein A3A78_04780 [candidate division WWE3 bacterium RIFCSPLOWO2_01_FULL_41_18]
MENGSIQKRIEIIETLSKELKSLNEMLKESLEKDPTYMKSEEEKSKIREEVKVAKNKAEEKSDVKNILMEIKEKRDEIKEAKETLSLELVEYYRQNSILTIEDGEGRVREMKISVRLSNPKPQ